MEKEELLKMKKTELVEIIKKLFEERTPKSLEKCCPAKLTYEESEERINDLRKQCEDLWKLRDICIDKDLFIKEQSDSFKRLEKDNYNLWKENRKLREQLDELTKKEDE